MSGGERKWEEKYLQKYLRYSVLMGREELKGSEGIYFPSAQERRKIPPALERKGGNEILGRTQLHAKMLLIKNIKVHKARSVLDHRLTQFPSSFSFTVNISKTDKLQSSFLSPCFFSLSFHFHPYLLM